MRPSVFPCRHHAREVGHTGGAPTGRSATRPLMAADLGDETPITQVTPPEQAHAFIDETPGLEDICREFPHYLCVYAPQITIPGYGGQFERLLEDLDQVSILEEPHKARDPRFRLRDPSPSIGSGCPTSSVATE
jgi:hypothetical protein